MTRAAGTLPLDVTSPRYVVIVNTLQERIEDGTYPPGSMLPSDAQVGDEFKVSRVTVVRALSILAQDGRASCLLP
jgi:GntR family transcriptional regulator